MAIDEPEREQQEEIQRVIDWRLRELLDAGYPLSVAERLAERTDIDLHRAIELVAEKGCQPAVAALILL